MFGYQTTDLEIQKWVFRNHGFVPERDWINDIKAKLKILIKHPGGQTPNTIHCPPENERPIVQALKVFGLIP